MATRWTVNGGRGNRRESSLKLFDQRLSIVQLFGLTLLSGGFRTVFGSHTVVCAVFL